MLHHVSGWIAALAFAVVGIVNLRGSSAVQQDFVRWGYPAWWCRVTGLLEIAVAVLIVVPSTRYIGLALGTVVIVAAVITVLRHRERSHLPPLIGFLALLAFGALA